MVNTGGIWQTYGLNMKSPQDEQPLSPPTPPAAPPAAHPDAVKRPPQPQLPREIGGRDGPEPTRFGDWEKAGRCIDF